MESDKFSFPLFPELSIDYLLAKQQKLVYSLILSFCFLVLVSGAFVSYERKRQLDKQQIELQLKSLREHLALIGSASQQASPNETLARLNRLETEWGQLYEKTEALRLSQQKSFSQLAQTLTESKLYPELRAQLLGLSGDEIMDLASLKAELYRLAEQLHDGPHADHADTVKEFADTLVPPEPEPESVSELVPVSAEDPRVTALEKQLAIMQQALAELTSNSTSMPAPIAPKELPSSTSLAPTSQSTYPHADG